MKRIALIILVIGFAATAIGGSSLAFFSDIEISKENIFTAGVWEIRAEVRIEPETLNLSSQGVITAFIALPEDYDLEDIDLYTVECEGAFAVSGTVDDDERVLIVKFNRQDLVNVPTGEEVVFTVTGELIDGISFTGSDIVKVIEQGATNNL